MKIFVRVIMHNLYEIVQLAVLI